MKTRGLLCTNVDKEQVLHKLMLTRKNPFKLYIGIFINVYSSVCVQDLGLKIYFYLLMLFRFIPVVYVNK